jgi:hypothetical protein
VNKDLALKAVDDAFSAGVARMHQVFVDGLLGNTDPTVLTNRFRAGLKAHVETHQHLAEAVEAYFKGQK